MFLFVIKLKCLEFNFISRSNFWADRFMDMEDRYSWEDRRRYQEEVEYYDWCRSMGPRNIGMGPPPLFGPPAMMGARPPPPHMVWKSYDKVYV